MTSIRSYILRGVLGIFFVGMTLISYISYQDATHEIEEIFDVQLTHSARVLNGLLPADLNEATLSRLKESLDFILHDELSLLLHGLEGIKVTPFGHAYESKLVFQVWNEKKKLLVQAARAPSTPLSPFKPGYIRTVIDGHRWRVFGLFDRAKKHWLFVAEREDVRGELVGKIAVRLILPILVGLPLLTIMIFLCVGQGLVPLTRLTGAIQKRNSQHLKPISEDVLPNEIQPVVHSLNSFIKSLDETLEREKRFTADVAHELRTLLAVLKVHAENTLNQDDPNQKSLSLDFLIQGIERSTRMVDQLLNLARLEHDLTRIEMKRLDLNALVVQVLREIAPLALQNKQEFGFDVSGKGFIIKGDEITLSLMIMNLVHNAIHYSPKGGSITVELEERFESVLLRVIDAGPGIPEALQKRIFDRFYRIEPGQTTGAGLGLSIVHRVLKSHDAQITLDKGHNGIGLCVSIVFCKPTN